MIPGWATDYRIFSTLDLPYNYLLPLEFSPLDFKRELQQELDKQRIAKISLLGWSMGAFLAAEFASLNTDITEELILLSIRGQFIPDTLRETKEKLKVNQRAWLYKFYLNCFTPADADGCSWFKKNLLKTYLDEMKLKDLSEGLNYLASVRINPGSLAGIKKIRIVHGSNDAIAPLEEAESIASCLPQVEFKVLFGLGHILFLNQRFNHEFNA